MISLILMILCFILFFTVIFLLMVGGKYLKAKIKEFLPFYQGKYSWVITFMRGGPIVVDYINTEHGTTKTTEEETQLENTTHSFIDKATKDMASIHSYDKKPAYVIAEGCPLNVLVKRQDYEPTIIEINKYKKKIKQIIGKNDKRYSIGLLNILFTKFKKLDEAFTYFPKARILLSKIFSNYNPERDYTLAEINDYLNYVHNGLSDLQVVLKDKDKAMINFTDYFSSGNLARIFNKRFQEAQTNGRLQMAQKYEDKNKLLKAGSVVLIIVVLIFGFLLIKQGNQIDELSTTVIAQAQTISTKLDDMNSNRYISPDIDLDNTPIQNRSSGSNGS